MADPEQVVACVDGCGNEFTIEEMTELDGSAHQCDECMGAVIARSSRDEIVPLGEDEPSTPGHVYLCWTLRSGFFAGDWKCTVTTVIEAGEGMDGCSRRPTGIPAAGVGRRNYGPEASTCLTVGGLVGEVYAAQDRGRRAFVVAPGSVAPP
jgi:hypothetical protein